MKTRDQKQQSVKNLSDNLTEAKAVVFADYKGLNMQQLAGLRDQLREQKAKLEVTKNTLLSLSLKSADYSLPEEEQKILEGPTATLFAYDDEISPIKALVKTLKDASLGQIKGGFLGRQFLDQSQVNQLALLPTKDELRGKTVGVLVAPLQGMVTVLQGNLRNLVYALNQIKIQKGGE